MKQFTIAKEVKESEVIFRNIDEKNKKAITVRAFDIGIFTNPKSPISEEVKHDANAGSFNRGVLRGIAPFFINPWSDSTTYRFIHKSIFNATSRRDTIIRTTKFLIINGINQQLNQQETYFFFIKENFLFIISYLNIDEKEFLTNIIPVEFAVDTAVPLVKTDTTITNLRYTSLFERQPNKSFISTVFNTTYLNKDGLAMKIKYSQQVNDNGTIRIREDEELFFYDKHLNKTKTIGGPKGVPNYTFLFQYDSLKRKINDRFISSEGQLFVETSVVYKRDDTFIEKKYSGNDFYTKVLSEKYSGVIFRDASGRIEKEVTYDGGVVRSEKIYDTKGRVVSYMTFIFAARNKTYYFYEGIQPGLPIEGNHTEEYFDKNGNMYLMKRYNTKGVLASYTIVEDCQINEKPSFTPY
ncbi:hypothetical protein [Emticicia agri]|uniref:Uncharacterized protein n=1 Tax=Emticicia agri TaxID=2492393 RepID=A0A4V1ZDD2_9BACT|nr:hypothetical protein [Emticicia agri]RYU95750.1 hypothetical protein EWM59_10325 [Emticicia agri]